MSWRVPAKVAQNCSRTPQGPAWLQSLPNIVESLASRWSLSVGDPFDNAEVSCAWVAPVARADGSAAILKLGLPHMEGQHESQGLRFWDGEPTVRLLASDENVNALLLERCTPGKSLRALPEPDQDLVIAELLPSLWRVPPATLHFRALSVMLEYWAEETLASAASWPDSGLVHEGLRLFQELPRAASNNVLLATDLHAGNVLSAQRKPWLVIDPKPFVGDPAYDATQHLFNCGARLQTDPFATIRRMADLLHLDNEHLRLWMFARAAAEPRSYWKDAASLTLARAIAP